MVYTLYNAPMSTKPVKARRELCYWQTCSVQLRDFLTSCRVYDAKLRVGVSSRVTYQELTCCAIGTAARGGSAVARSEVDHSLELVCAVISALFISVILISLRIAKYLDLV
jgi:hypothetical protein